MKKIQTKGEIKKLPFQPEQEQQLILCRNKALSLKRKRQGGEHNYDYEFNMEEEDTGKRHKKLLEWGGNYARTEAPGGKTVMVIAQEHDLMPGDFNEVLSQSEKLKSCKFTWQSNPRNGIVVKEKIDRVLANWPWRMLYENALATALPEISFHHSTIILWPKPKLSSCNSFKYEAKWVEHEDCAAIVREG
ncbi:hypothetical protein SESBI_25514 [Sesbania bispinosa]|nr:hypothetical protein SESBI_25514 [Sesbania bispinosa]